MKKTLAMIIALMMSVSVLTACRHTQENDVNTLKQAESPTDIVAEQPEDPEENSKETELAGSWQDEVSRRASMEISQNQDGSYKIVVLWGSSAFETSTWEISGSFDAETGVLSYNDGKYSVHYYDENGTETVSDEETTKGSFTINGDKLRWQDSKNSEEGMFVKVSD